MLVGAAHPCREALRESTGWRVFRAAGEAGTVDRVELAGSHPAELETVPPRPSAARHHLEVRPTHPGPPRPTHRWTPSSPEPLPAFLEEAFNRWKMQPAGIYSALLEGTGLGVKAVEIRRSEQQGELCLKLDADFVESEARPCAALSHHFTLTPEGRHTVRHAWVAFDEEHQARGLARRLMANSIPLYRSLKVDEITLHAGGPVGGYAWARYGFQLQTSSRPGLVRQVEARLEKLALPPETRSLVEQVLKSEEPTMVWALSDLRQPVTQFGRQLALGKALLLGTRWDGVLRLDDSQAMARLRDYVQDPRV